MENIMNEILRLAEQGNYEEILNVISGCEYKKDKKIYNIKKGVERYLYLKNVKPCTNTDRLPELTDNVWANYFACLRVNNYEKAYEIILEIHDKSPKVATEFYLILTKDIKKIVDIYSNMIKKIDIINNQILELFEEKRFVSNNDLNELEFLLESKIDIEEKAHIDYCLDILTLNLIKTIKQLDNEPFINKKMFESFDYKGDTINKLYQSLEIGDYPSALKFLKNSYKILEKNSDKIYPILLYRLLRLLEYNYNKKNYQNDYKLTKNPVYFNTSKYNQLYDEIENDNYLEALKESLENEYTNDYSMDIVKVLALRNNKD